MTESERKSRTFPKIGLAQTQTSVDVSDLGSHDQLASCCGLAPATQQPGTSAHYGKAQRGGNKQPENLPILSCNSLARSKGRYGRYMRGCLARGMTYPLGAQGHGPQAPRGDLRGHARRGAVLGGDGGAGPGTAGVATRKGPRVTRPHVIAAHIVMPLGHAARAGILP